MNILLNKDFKKCDYCKGQGRVTKDEGHDCWGRSEWSYIICPRCKGDTFLLSENLIRKLKDKINAKTK